MAVTGYPYSISGDFPNGTVNVETFWQEIEDSSISEALTKIDVRITGDDVCEPYFANALSPGDQATLGGIVAAHQGVAPVVPVLERQIAESAQSAVDAPPMVVTTVELNPNKLPADNVSLTAIAAKQDAVNAVVELYDVTDGVSMGTLTFTSTTQEAKSLPLSLSVGDKLYELRLYLDAAPGASDAALLYGASLVVTQ
jgi:hypothetical protein